MIGEEAVVTARAVRKLYGSFAAVDGVDFEIHPGECVGFLGPNGAGKTTIVRMVTCSSPITEGEIRVFGLDVRRSPREVKAMLGICPQEDNLDPDFTVEKNLIVYARYFSLPAGAVRARAGELLDLMQLREKSRAKTHELSGGMKRRLILARALLNQPRMLVLDEPTTGLDPQARQLIWQRVRMLKTRGTTILLTTHYMEEAAQLCDRVLLMDQGRILLNGRPSDLIEKEVGREVIELWNHSPEVMDFIREKGWEHETLDERVHVFLPRNDDGGRELGTRFPHQEHLLRLATLEDVFLRKAGRALRDG